MRGHWEMNEKDEGIFVPDEVQLVQKVGVFWCIDDIIVGDSVEIDKADRNGDQLQYGSHPEYWERLVPKTEIERKLKMHPYNHYPLGFVIFFPAREVVRIYASRRMDMDNINDALDFFDHGPYDVEIEDLA
jgi:hypothetical protein